MNRIASWIRTRLSADVASKVERSRSMPNPLQSSQMMNREPIVIDLSERTDLTCALLDNTRAWRERAVHEIVLRDSDHVDAVLTYQIRIPVPFVQEYEPNARSGDQIRILLPFTIRPKQLLFKVDFIGVQGNSTALLLRDDAARFQAQYIAHVSGMPHNEHPLMGALWVGVSAYTKFAWREHYANAKPPFWRRLWPGFESIRRTRALVTYLNSDLIDLDAKIKNHHITDWLRRIDPVRVALVDALAEDEDPESSSECILLAIPFMPYAPGSIADIDALVEEFCATISAMDMKARQVVAEYGRRWEAIVDTVVPIGQGCSIKLSEQRPWVRAPSPVMEQEIAFGDATTTHVEIRAADPDIVIDRPSISDLSGERSDIAVADEIRVTADAIAIYASEVDRPYLARVKVHARVRWGHRLLIIWLMITIVIAGTGAAVLPENADLVDFLTLLIFPLTLAGTVVLTREATPLAERLLRRWKNSLILAISVLWIVTLGRLLLNADVQWAELAWFEIKNVAGWFWSLLS